ncbi:MAG: hypothetical protein A4E42_00446 [Methanoregulaceae archaeon PtaU1.Bin222]|nr:MAG: hypothetical protein A4E42_00446 [Methanoregulaceae archaeon PtaU1.Bin222]
MKKWDKETDQKMPSHMPLCGIQRSGRFVLGIKTDAPIHSYVWTGAFIGGNVRSESSTGRKDHDYQ